MKLVPDQSQRAAEKEILEGLGFTVIEMTPVPFSLRREHSAGTLSRTSEGKMNEFGRLL
jgi:hypothetical protein